MTLIENIEEVLTNSRNLIAPLNSPFDTDVDRPINIGIDKIRVGFSLIPPYYRDEEALRWVRGGRIATWPITEHANLSLFTNRVKGVHRGYFTFNPSRLIDPHGITCATWDETLVAMGKCAEITYNQFFIFKPSLADLDMYGIHLAADFGPIPDMQRILNQARYLKIFKGSKPHCYFSADGSAIESVYFNSVSRGQVKFYDKSVQANLASPVLRIEYETNRTLHRADGSDKVRSLNSDVLERLFRTRLEPLVRALNPNRIQSVDKILQDPTDSKMLINICGREFLKRLNIHPPSSASYRAKKQKFELKYPHSQIEEIL
jgi:hypothetical protein